MNCFFVSDLHGKIDRYQKLFDCIKKNPPDALFIGGDLLPSPLTALSSKDIKYKDFVNDFLVPGLIKLKHALANSYPRVFIILGNDDGQMEEAALLDAAALGVWQYCHNRCISWEKFSVFGYSYVPPTPFRLKDWERFDVSRYVDPGCTAPYEGAHSKPKSEHELYYATISEDLEKLTAQRNLEQAIFLFHAPPYKSKLDRAALDGKMIDHAPLDVHIGSVAIRRFIEKRQPLVTLHGHVHESARLTGSWRDQIGHTQAFNAAHDGPELSLIRFDPLHPAKATRELL